MKLQYCWWPRRLVKREQPLSSGCPWYLKKVGWVWLQQAVLSRNIEMGWIAIVENQTDENFKAARCPHCDGILDAYHLSKLKGLKNE